MAEKHEKAASLMARAVLKLREQDKVDAVGAIEELLHDDDDAPQLAGALVVSFLSKVEVLVDGGGSRWEEEGSAAQFTLMFKLLHDMLKQLASHSQYISEPTGVAAMERFADCGMRLAEAEVDVGRQLDLTAVLTVFLRELAALHPGFRQRLFNSAFSSKTENLAQVLASYGQADPIPFFREANARMKKLDDDVSDGDNSLEGAFFALRTLSVYCTKQSPMMHKVTETLLLDTLVDSIRSILNRELSASSSASSSLSLSLSLSSLSSSAQHSGASGGHAPSSAVLTTAKQHEAQVAGGNRDDLDLVTLELAVLAMFLPQIGPMVTNYLPSLLDLSTLCLKLDSATTRPTSLFWGSQDGDGQGARWDEQVSHLIRHVYALFPCAFVERMRQESAKNNDAFFAALARRTQLLPITCRLFRPPEEEASPEARRKMPPSGDDFVARMPTSPGNATSANFLQGLFPSTAPSYHQTASPPSPARIQAAASSTSSFEQEGKRAGYTYIQRQVALLSSDLMWEVHMRRQAAEYLRESQRKNAQSRVEGANMQALQASVARLQEDNKRLTEELHLERQSVNNFQISKREWEDKLQKKINRNGEEKARMVEQLGEAQRIAQDLTVINQKLKEEAAQRALHVMQLQCDIVKLSEARKDVTEMKTALDRFKKESQDLADLKGSREDLMRQIAGKDGEAKRMANAREQADKEKKKLYSENAELARVVETLRSEKDSLSKQLALAKDMLGKAGDISEQKIRLVEKKYSATKQINGVLEDRILHLSTKSQARRSQATAATHSEGVGGPSPIWAGMGVSSSVSGSLSESKSRMFLHSALSDSRTSMGSIDNADSSH